MVSEMERMAPSSLMMGEGMCGTSLVDSYIELLLQRSRLGRSSKLKRMVPQVHMFFGPCVSGAMEPWYFV